MKQFFYLLIAAFLGGIIANQMSAPQIIKEVPVHATMASIPAKKMDVDFVDASESAMQAVVFIQAEESTALAKQRYQKERQSRRNSMWDNFFGMDNDFFGRGSYPKKGSGSGVIISNDGYVVTNNHVVGFADNITVTTYDGKKLKGVKIGTDPATDLAVIKIESDGLSTLDYGNSDNIRVGEWVLAVGNPFSLTSTVTAGIVSAKGRDLNIIKGQKAIEEFIQTDAAVNPGNSGGALVDVDGKLVGINTAIATPTGVFAGYSFAIPSNLVQSVIRDIIEKGGDIDRNVSLGISGYDVDKEIIEEFKLDIDRGFYVDEVDRGSAAQLSGILPGDVVISIQGNEVDSFDVIKEEMRLTKVGDDLELKVRRNGEEKNIRIKLRKGL